MKYVEDYGLTADQLDDKYNPDGDGEHPGYLRAHWREAVWVENTISGYWKWVVYQLQLEEDAYYFTSGKGQMNNYVVLYRMPESLPLELPMGFSCLADNTDHAEEQCKNAYPECNIVWVWKGPEGVGIQPALTDYYTSGEGK